MNTVPFNRAASARPAQPQLSESQAAALVHDSYLVQIHQNLCTNCACGEQFISLFEVWVHPTLTGQTKYAVKRPTTTIKPGLEIVYLGMPEVQMPICSECVTTYTVDSAKAQPVATREAWAETLRRKYAAPEPERKAPARHIPTLGEL